MSFEIHITGLDQVTKEIEAAVETGLWNGVEKLALMGVGLVQSLSPVASGILANSETFKMEGGAEMMVKATIFAGPPADVYAAPVETGAAPHFPPPSALLLWVKRRFNPSSEKEALSIAFAVAKNIAKRGTPGHYMFEKTYAQLEGDAQGVIELSIAEAIALAGFGGHA